MDSERLTRVRQAMEASNLDSLVCRLPENVRMLSGYWPLNGFSFLLLPPEGTPLAVVPHCEEPEARGELWNADCVSFLYGVLDAGDPYAAIAAALKHAGPGRKWTRIGIEGAFESVAPPWNAAEPAVPAALTRAMLESVFGARALVDATALLMAQRARKTPDEQAALRLANEISAFGLAAFEQTVDTGASGVELVSAVERAVMLKGTGHRGARRVRAFAQVATGPEETAVAYRPMEISTTRALNPGELALLELAVVVDGFWCDRTRPRVAGSPMDRQQAMFEAVKSAQEAAVQAVRAGARCGDVDSAARRVIHDAGWTDREFLHVTGHGLGFRYHEPAPTILPGSSAVLAEGMVHTVEPGVYVPGIGGMRIEDDVLVTETGAEVLGPYAKALS